MTGNPYTFDKRLRKLEPPITEGLESLTDDELQVAMLENYLELASDKATPKDERDEACRKAAEISADIALTVERQVTPEYQQHLAYVRAVWQRGHASSYEPALFYRNGFGEYSDWDKPDVMTRRAELREHPSVSKVLSRLTGHSNG
jgi:hypothetical protein